MNWLTKTRNRIRQIWNLPSEHDRLVVEVVALRETVDRLESKQNEIEESRVQYEKQEVAKAKLMRGNINQRLRWLEKTDGGRDNG